MKIIIILGHPDHGSFNHAVARTAFQTLGGLGHEVILHDLYAEGFDPALPAGEIPEKTDLPVEIDGHCRDLASAEGLVIVHPNWWGMPPAVVKGWVDRVFRPGVAYRFPEGDGGEGVPEGLLKARAAVVFNTSNTPDHREHNVFGDPLESLWKTCILEFCGIRTFYRRMFNVMVTSTPDQRAEWLEEVRAAMEKYYPASGR